MEQDDPRSEPKTRQKRTSKQQGRDETIHRNAPIGAEVAEGAWDHLASTTLARNPVKSSRNNLTVHCHLVVLVQPQLTLGARLRVGALGSARAWRHAARTRAQGRGCVADGHVHAQETRRRVLVLAHCALLADGPVRTRVPSTTRLQYKGVVLIIR